MRIPKLLCAMALVAAFSLVAVATASAEEHLWVLLPGTPHETFEGASGKASLQAKGSATITCKKSELLLTDKELEASSEFLEEGSVNGMATLALGVLHFTGCTVSGLAANSLGDKPGIILVHLHIHTCMISPSHYGLLIKPLPVHIEVPSTGLLLAVEGDFVAEIKAEVELKSTLVIEQKEGKQTIEKCEGGEKETLLTSIDGGTQIESGEEAKEGFVKWDHDQVLMES